MIHYAKHTINGGGTAMRIRNPTAEQQAVINSTAPVAVVNAVAGSGKTALLMEIARQYPTGLYLAYTKAIAEDVKKKLPLKWNCKTFAAFGLKLCRDNMTIGKVNFHKVNKWGSMLSFAELANYHMEMCGSMTDESWKETCDRFHVPHYFIDKAKTVLTEMMNMKDIISGTEMMYWPIMHGWSSKKKFPIVLVDEVQDLTPLQLELLKLIPTDRLIVVGDTNQSIFGFRGADVNAFDRVDNTYPTYHYDLTESFRCPQIVINEVNHLVMKMWSRRQGGYVDTYNMLSVHDFPSNCFILSRHNALIYRTAHLFIKEGIPFSTSSTVVRRLKRNISQMIGSAQTIQEAKDNAKKELEERKKTFTKHKWSMQELQNQYEAVFTLLDMHSSLAELKNFANKMEVTQHNSSKRKLMTIHAAKGLEHEDVFLLNPDFYQVRKHGNTRKQQWEIQQEKNLFYVACTRSTQGLSFVHHVRT